MWYCKDYDPVKVGSIDGTDIDPHDAAVIRAIRSNCKHIYHAVKIPMHSFSILKS